MNHYYSPIIYVIWFIGSALQLLSCWAVVKKGYFPHWKAFAYYLFLMPALSIPMIPIAIWGTFPVYTAMYVIGAVMEALLLSLVVLEIMVKVMEPFEALPGKTIARFGFLAVLGISLAVTISVMVHGHGSPPQVEIALTVERTIFLVDALLLWILLFQSKSFGISWKSSVAEIAIGFVLYLTVQATARFMILLYTDNSILTIANITGQIAYLISLCSWIWTMHRRDPAPPHPAPEVLARIQDLAKDYDAVPKEKILAAMGIRINRPDQEELSTEEHETEATTER
ncbi:MAG TPA: hypothetical protein VJN64_11575 [Terriglobales bacterium]|nr:hypothetical protein [Terriglobales bacterium]